MRKPGAHQNRIINAALGCATGLFFLIVGRGGEWTLPLALSVTVLLSAYVVRVQVMWRQAPITAALVIAAVLTRHSEMTAAEVVRILRDDGLLFIAVPNPKCITFNEQNGSLLDTPPNHIGRWSPAAFQILGARHRLRFDRHEIEPFSLGAFMKQDVVFSYLRRSQQAGTGHAP